MLIVQIQRADESIPELIQEVQGAAQKCHMSPDGFSAGQSADGLVDHSLEDGGGQIFPGGTFIDQRLDVRLGKHAAAGSDGVESLVILCVLVETGGVWRRDAIWSMKEPVPPAQTPFMRCSMLPPSK